MTTPRPAAPQPPQAPQDPPSLRTAPRPTRTAAYLTQRAANLLPPGPQRDRYALEYVADLYHLTRTQQLSYALGVLTSTRALRRALTQEHHMTTTPTTSPRRPLRCRLRLHSWHTQYTEDGQSYLCCRRCGTDRGSSSSGPDDWAAGLG